MRDFPQNMSLYPLQNMPKYVTVSTNTWDTKYVTVSNTWAIKDTVTLYFTKYTLCSGALFWDSIFYLCFDNANMI